MHSDDSGSKEFEYDPLSETQINGVGKGSIGTAPERIAAYRLEAEIGRGGMGVVYLAIDSTLQRRVALKLLLHSAQIDVTSVKRFHNEALAAAKLSHPNIVHVHNVGEDKGIHFIAMQFIEGSNLQQIMKRIREQVSEQHPVAGSTMVTHLIFKESLLFLLIVYAPVRSTQSLSHGSASASFSGRMPYLV